MARRRGASVGKVNGDSKNSFREKGMDKRQRNTVGFLLKFGE